MFKKIIRARLEKAVKRYIKKNPHVKLVAVVGSVGKTSTKIAIGTVLHEKFRVRLHEGNHNAELSAPLAILGVEFPEDIRRLSQWRAVFKAIKLRLKQPDEVDVIVQELGTDRIGQIPHFGTYLSPDLTVVTSVSAEHMEYFKTLDAVAAEELAAANFSKAALINRDDVDGIYAATITNGALNTYGTTSTAEYRFETEDYTFEDGFVGQFIAPDLTEPVDVMLHLIGDHSTRAAVAAGAVGLKLGMTAEEIARGIAKIRPVKGRMNILRGMEGSTIIDDTYNSSPLAVSSALQALYQTNVPQRIVVLGSMNELGDTSEVEHKAVGKLCDPSLLTHVITVGDEANQWIAPVAEANGCHVVTCRSALEAGAQVRALLEPGAIMLFKGSQGGIYLEEAVKVVLHSTDDDAQLVRQSPEWMEKKRKFFESLTSGE